MNTVGNLPEVISFPWLPPLAHGSAIAVVCDHLWTDGCLLNGRVLGGQVTVTSDIIGQLSCDLGSIAQLIQFYRNPNSPPEWSTYGLGESST